MSWYERSFRKAFFDFHTHSSAVEVAKDFDADAWAEQLLKANVQAVSTIVQCKYGWRYYRKGSIGWVHPRLSKDLDIVGETINVCHERGIRVIGYYHTLGSEMLAATKPEWLERDPLGRPQDIWICLLSPALEEYVLPQLEEFNLNYDADGMFFDFSYARGSCFCQSCRERFKEDTGLELPLDRESPYWGRFVKWKLEKFKEIRQAICDAVHRGNSNVLVAFNWCYSIRMPEKPPKDVGFLSLDIYPDNQVFNASMQARFWATMNKPFDIMNTAFLQWWGDWGVKTAVALKQECATIIANGGRTWIGYQMYPQFKVEAAVMSQLAEALAFVKEREHICMNQKIQPYIAISYSTRSPLIQSSFYVDERSIKGAHKILLESGFHYNIVLDEILENEINRYKAVILPDQRYISGEFAEALRDFVSNGGGLIATCLTGTLDENLEFMGRFELEDLFGVSLDGKYPYDHAYMEVSDERLKKNVLEMPILVWGEFVYAKPKSAETLAHLRGIYLRSDGKPLLASSPPGSYTGYPMITLNKFGKGKVAYIACDVFSSYILKNQWIIKHIIKNILNIILPEKLVEVDAPAGVEVVLAEQGGKKLIHLINHYGERPFSPWPFGDNNALTENIIPIHDIMVKVKCEENPIKIKLEPEGRELEWKRDGEMITILVPKLEIHSCIVIEFL